MPRQRGQRLNFQFNKGWNTEASPLTFPEGTAQDLENVILDIDGSIRRRPGVNFDKQYAVITGATTNSTKALGFNQWENVAGSGTLSFLVTQVGTTLYFHTQKGPDSISSYLGSINFSSFATDAVEAEKAVVAVASGLGYLFVVGEYIEPFYVEYDFATGDLIATEIIVEIRDFEGVDDGLEVSERPSTLSNLHKYNLRNQGWPTSFPLTNGTSGDPVTYFYNNGGEYPSNADIIGYGKLENATEPSDIGRFSPSQLRKNNFGTTPAPKGKYVFNAFDINRGTIVGGATRKYTLRRPRAVAFHNGRVFYSGVNATGYTSNVYYSQQLTDVDRVGKCYQENDPTAEEFNELLATDGGLLTIPNAGGILALAEGPAGIIVFASNGIWEITGQEGKFSATEFYVRKVTDMGCIGAETVINADGTLIYWSNAGIIALQPDQITSNLAPNNLTQNTIQTGYLLIGGVQQQWARGIYIPEEKKAVWIYSTNTTSFDGVNNRFKYNGMLVLDMQLGAFYKYRISDTTGTTPYIAGITKTVAFTSSVVQGAVTAEGEVVTAGGEAVTAGTGTAVGSEVEVSAWKLLTVKGGTSLTFSEFNYDGFYDWYYHDGVGVDYSSFIETGYDTGGIPMFDKKPTYIWVYLSRYSKTRLSGGYYNIGVGTTTEYVDFCNQISTATYTGNNFTPTGAADTWDVIYSYDGTKVFTLDHNTGNGTIRSYPLSIPYDIGSIGASDGTQVLTGGTTAIPHSLHLSSDGTYLFTAGQNYIKRYTFGTVNDISTLAYSQQQLITSLDQEGTLYTATELYNATFNFEGTRMYVHTVAPSQVMVYQFTLTTPWDITSNQYVTSVNLNTAIGTADPHKITWSQDGANAYVLDLTANTVVGMELSDATDISTASATGESFSFNVEVGGDSHGFGVSPDGTKFIIADSDSSPYEVYEYEINCV